MVIRNSKYPRLPRVYWGELIYATPGCGKTFVANKYRDVVDGDDLIVEAISKAYPSSDHDYYNEFINFNSKTKWKVYKIALRKMKRRLRRFPTSVVLFGTMDLMNEADRIFLEKDNDYARNEFDEQKQYCEEENAADVDVPVHYIYDYLDNSLQETCRFYYGSEEEEEYNNKR